MGFIEQLRQTYGKQTRRHIKRLKKSAHKAWLSKHPEQVNRPKEILAELKEKFGQPE